MITGYWVSQMVHVAAKLGLADHLADGPRTTDELAAATGTHARSLYRLLRALASVGIFSEADDGRFTQTALSEALRKDVPGSQWAMAVMMGDEHYHAWGDLLESVRTGQTAFDRLYGKPIFEYLGEHPEQAEVFDAAMTSIHGRETQAVLDAYDLIGRRRPGRRRRRQRHEPDRRPGPLSRDEGRPVRPAARRRAGGGEPGAGRVGKSLPGRRRRLLRLDPRAGRRLLPAAHHPRLGRREGGAHPAEYPHVDAQGARLLVVEHVLPPGNEPSFGKLLDLNMLLLPGGVERTADEFRRLYEGSGFRLTRIVPTQGDLSVVEGQPV